MEIDDLRVGSIVQLRCGNIIKIDRVNGKFVEVFFNSKSYHSYHKHNISGVLLTEEILLSCEGIVKNELTGHYDYDDSLLHFSIEDNNWDDPCLDVFMGGQYLTCIEYVHELQDIVKVLMKENLKIKLC